MQNFNERAETMINKLEGLFTGNMPPVTRFIFRCVFAMGMLTALEMEETPLTFFHQSAGVTNCVDADEAQETPDDFIIGTAVVSTQDEADGFIHPAIGRAIAYCRLRGVELPDVFKD